VFRQFGNSSYRLQNCRNTPSMDVYSRDLKYRVDSLWSFARVRQFAINHAAIARDSFPARADMSANDFYASK
jgi:hypothetical protein